MNEEMVTIENAEVVEVYEEAEKAGSGIIGKVILGLVAVGIGAGALVYKNRDKIEERRIRKLEKKGYVISRPEQNDVADSEECDDVE